MALGLAAALAVALGLGTSLLGGDPGVRFEVWEAERGRVAYARVVSIGETLVLEHVHSVHRRPVVETFSVQTGEALALEEMRFDATAANLPSGPERIGESTTTFVAEEGGYRVVHHGRTIGALPLRVGGAEVDHAITFEDGAELRLLDVVPAGTHVDLRVRPGR